MTATTTAGDTRRQILRAALTEMAGGGPRPARMDEIAARAGVSRGTLYYHFHGREELQVALIEDALDDLAATIADPVASGDPLAVVESLLHFYAANEDRCRFLFRHLLLAPERTSEIMRREKDQLVTPLADCLAIRGHDQPEVLAEALLGQVNGLVFGRIMRGEPLDLDQAGPSLLATARRVLAS